MAHAFYSAIPSYIPPVIFTEAPYDFPAYEPSTCKLTRSRSNRVVYDDDPWNSAKSWGLYIAPDSGIDQRRRSPPPVPSGSQPPVRRSSPDLKPPKVRENKQRDPSTSQPHKQSKKSSSPPPPAQPHPPSLQPGFPHLHQRQPLSTRIPSSIQFNNSFSPIPQSVAQSINTAISKRTEATTPSQRAPRKQSSGDKTRRSLDVPSSAPPADEGPKRSSWSNNRDVPKSLVPGSSTPAQAPDDLWAEIRLTLAFADKLPLPTSPVTPPTRSIPLSNTSPKRSPTPPKLTVETRIPITRQQVRSTEPPKAPKTPKPQNAQRRDTKGRAPTRRSTALTEERIFDRLFSTTPAPSTCTTPARQERTLSVLSSSTVWSQPSPSEDIPPVPPLPTSLTDPNKVDWKIVDNMLHHEEQVRNRRSNPPEIKKHDSGKLTAQSISSSSSGAPSICAELLDSPVDTASPIDIPDELDAPNWEHWEAEDTRITAAGVVLEALRRQQEEDDEQEQLWTNVTGLLKTRITSEHSSPSSEYALSRSGTRVFSPNR